MLALSHPPHTNWYQAALHKATGIVAPAAAVPKWWKSFMFALHKAEETSRGDDAPKGFGTLRFLNPFESLPSLSIRCTIRPPQGWESKNAAIRRERASGNDTGQCPISWECRNAATRKRAALRPAAHPWHACFMKARLCVF